MLITVIGRGHSGTRAMSKTLSASGVYMGAELNPSADLIPAEDMYEACRVFAKYVKHLGGLEWDFSAVENMEIDPAFTRLVESYLASVLGSDAPLRGWKLPETVLVLPWILRMFPEAYYLYWVRDPRDSILGAHITDDLSDFGVPYEHTEDLQLRRAISWKYQYDLMQATPSPEHRIDVRFEDFVLHQDDALARLGEFLGFPLAKLDVAGNNIGRWRTAEAQYDFPFFPPETLYDEVPA